MLYTRVFECFALVPGIVSSPLEEHTCSTQSGTTRVEDSTLAVLAERVLVSKLISDLIPPGGPTSTSLGNNAPIWVARGPPRD
jgi:hypothetical protein